MSVVSTEFLCKTPELDSNEVEAIQQFVPHAAPFTELKINQN